MNPPTPQHTAKTVLIVGTLPAVAVFAHFLGLMPKVELATQVITYFLWVATTVAARHHRIYLGYERAKRYILNATSRWTFAARFRLAKHTEPSSALDDVVRRMLALPDSRVQARQDRTVHLLVSSVPVSVRVYTATEDTIGDDDGNGWELAVEVPDARTVYRHLRYFFEKLLDPALEDARKIIAPVSEKYELAFGFPEGENPYFGLLVRRLQPRGDFRWDYVTKTAHQGVIAVTKDALKVVTRNAAEMRDCFREFVALALAPVRPQ